MNMSVIGSIVQPSLHEDDDDAYDDEGDSDDTNWDTRFPSWSYVIWLTSLSWLAATMSMNAQRLTDSLLDNGLSNLSFQLSMLPMAYGFECFVAQSMISFDEKYPCVTLTTFFPCLFCAGMTSKIIDHNAKPFTTQPYLDFVIQFLLYNVNFLSQIYNTFD